MFDVLEQARRAEHFVTAVDTAQELRRSHESLNRIELRSLDHPRCGAELASGVKFCLDFSVAAGLDQAGEHFHPFMLRIVEGLRAQFHNDRCLGAKLGRRQSKSNAGAHTVQNSSPGENSVGRFPHWLHLCSSRNSASRDGPGPVPPARVTGICLPPAGGSEIFNCDTNLKYYSSGNGESITWGRHGMRLLGGRAQPRRRQPPLQSTPWSRRDFRNLPRALKTSQFVAWRVSEFEILEDQTPSTRGGPSSSALWAEVRTDRNLFFASHPGLVWTLA